jgi:hypothetical protein
MGKFKQSKITRSNIISITGAGMYETDNTTIGPVRKGGTGNTIVSSGSSEYDGGDRVIGFHNGYDIDGDILITVGWGDGCAVRRLNNDGSMTKLYHDNNALWRDTGSTYNHLQSCAMAKGVNKAVIMSYNVYGYSIIDYRGAVDGITNSGAVIREARPTHTNPTDFIDEAGDRSNGYVRRAGMWYGGGLCAAGEWVYGSSHDAIHYKKFPRRNLATGVHEMLEGAGVGSDKYTGSADNDRNGYRGYLNYDEVNDRMYYWDYEGNGTFTVILDASTSSPKTLWCDLEDSVAGTNPTTFAANGYSREQGMVCLDPANAPNVVICGGYDRILKVDYSNCFTGGAPQVLDQNYLRNYEEGIDRNDITRIGSKFQKLTGNPMDRMPGYPNHVAVSGDRGLGRVDSSFHDVSTHTTYSPKSMSNYVEDQASVYGGSARGRSWQSDYGVNMVRMASANGTEYYIRMGYGADGHSFRIYPATTNPWEFIGNWSIEFGTFSLDNSANVDMVFVGGLSSFIIPSSCSLVAYVSNDNGSTWETYDQSSTTSHVFSTTGTQLRLKLVATGHPDKAPFLQTTAGLVLDYGSMHDAAKDSNIKHKVTRTRLR